MTEKHKKLLLQKEIVPFVPSFQFALICVRTFVLGTFYKRVELKVLPAIEL